MKANEFPAFLRTLNIPGISVKAAGGRPGSGLETGFITTDARGARIAWQVVFQDEGFPVGEGPAILFPETVPLAPERLVPADLEKCIAAWIGQSEAAPHVSGVFLYGGTGRRSILHGMRLDLYTGGRVFIQALWILAPGENPDASNKYRTHNTI